MSWPIISPEKYYLKEAQWSGIGRGQYLCGRTKALSYHLTLQGTIHCFDYYCGWSIELADFTSVISNVKCFYHRLLRITSNHKSVSGLSQQGKWDVKPEGMRDADFSTSAVIPSFQFSTKYQLLTSEFLWNCLSNCGHHVASSLVSDICFFVTLISSSLSCQMALWSTNPVSFLYYSVYSAMSIWENKIRANNCME